MFLSPLLPRPLLPDFSLSLNYKTVSEWKHDQTRKVVSPGGGVPECMAVLFELIYCRQTVPATKT